jgi:hypothetical protein
MSKAVFAFKQAVLLLALTIAVSFKCLAQEASRPDRGVMPNGSYSVSDIENINLLNGNLNIKIPLASLPPISGGNLSWTVSAQYNSKLWDITREQANEDPLTWAPYYIDYPGAGGGWTIGATYAFFFRNSATWRGSGIRETPACRHGIWTSSTTILGGKSCCECRTVQSTSFDRSIIAPTQAASSF